MEVDIKYKKQVHMQTESILKTFAIFLENVYVYFLSFFFLLFLRYFHEHIMYRKDNAILQLVLKQ